MKTICDSYYNENLRDRIMELQMDLAKKILFSVADVVMEAGYWAKSQRESIKNAASQVGAIFQIVLYISSLSRS
jgi:hypothetical protein